VFPIVIDEGDRVVAGWGLVLAARKPGQQVPAVTLSGLRDAELRILRVALNRVGEDSRWERDLLALEFSDILELEADIDLEIRGFEIAEIDGLLEGNGPANSHVRRLPRRNLASSGRYGSRSGSTVPASRRQTQLAALIHPRSFRSHRRSCVFHQRASGSCRVVSVGLP
jgi:hypothetical protein